MFHSPGDFQPQHRTAPWRFPQRSTVNRMRSMTSSLILGHWAGRAEGAVHAVPSLKDSGRSKHPDALDA